MKSFPQVTLLLLLAAGLAACAPPVQVVPVTSVPVRSRTPEPETTEPEQPPAPRFEGVTTGRFDGGKMWTFDNPPLEYFGSAYAFTPDSAWFAKARSGALRFGTFCSASFVSSSGLVMTNHHCARESITQLTEEGEDLLEAGFLAESLDQERKVEDLFVDQLVSIRDVTGQIYSESDLRSTPSVQAEAREQRADALEKLLSVQAKAADSTRFVEVIPLYHGGQYAAYTFRRYDDVRLVMAPELQIGFFGGDWDNFTFPRYNLDMSFFRVYHPSGDPLTPEHHFSWSQEGAKAGEPVFVVGNPGSTSRLSTVEQLEYERDIELPVALDLLEDRADILGEYIAAHPEQAETFDLQNGYFSLQNSRKSMAGQLSGLESEWLIPRRGAAETELMSRISESDSLESLYGTVLDEIGAVQQSKEASAGAARAFTFFLNPAMSSRVLSRAMYGYVYTLLRQRGAPPDQLKEIRKEALEIEDWPEELEKEFIALRLRELREALGNSDASVKRILGGLTPQEAATALVDSTALADSAGFRALLDKNYLFSGDATVSVIQALGPLYFTLNQQLDNFQSREEGLNARLARARFAVFGDAEPPDASFSLRIADGVVAGYDYNGTTAPPHTTFYGLYDRYFASGERAEWLLPDRWIDPPGTFDYSTPMNLVSTNDIAGGNSGSPLLNANLEVVGLVFDSNVEALPNEFLYTDTAGRTVSVDARGILEALEEIYGADKLARELRFGRRPGD
jgi:peptidase S46-like protein